MEECKLAVQICIDMYLGVCSPKQERLCDQELTLPELTKTSMTMVDDKSLGLDGYPFEFYKVTWEFVGPNGQPLESIQESCPEEILGCTYQQRFD